MHNAKTKHTQTCNKHKNKANKQYKRQITNQTHIRTQRSQHKHITTHTRTHKWRKHESIMKTNNTNEK